MPSSPPLATDRNVAASPHNRALAALLFLYRQVLGIEPGNIEQGGRAKRPLRLPVVFTREGVGRILQQLSGAGQLVVGLLYGSGLRLLPVERRGEWPIRHQC